MERITQSELQKYITYDPLTGDMWWIKSNSIRVKVGSPVSGKSVRGYKRAQINHIRYKAHDLAWLYMTGSFPENIIDHKDCNPENLQWDNLREATQQQNCANRSMSKNNTSGAKGVTWNKKERRWYARVGVEGKRVTVGTFEDFFSAAASVRKFREKAHGAFANHGEAAT